MERIQSFLVLIRWKIASRLLMNWWLGVVHTITVLCGAPRYCCRLISDCCCRVHSAI